MNYHSTSWRIPPERLQLEHDDIHIWRAELSQSVLTRQFFLQILTSDEHSKAKRFYSQKDQDYFIVARGILRIILSRYLHVEPHQLRFCYGPYGKPALIETPGREALRFNVSHSHELVLFGVARGRELGLDIEYMREGFASAQLAEQFFSSSEIAMLRALPTDQQMEGFFNCWTRKEAYVKARGKGLSLPLDRFDVSLAPGEPAALLSVRAERQGGSDWSLLELSPGPGYIAAVAAEGRDWRLSCWQWST
ncbi:MAG TPA: 4'-phosphopantetheinyl transferase superfamily protein [Pyrinomonadaceae bacterium]